MFDLLCHHEVLQFASSAGSMPDDELCVYLQIRCVACGVRFRWDKRVKDEDVFVLVMTAVPDHHLTSLYASDNAGFPLTKDTTYE